MLHALALLADPRTGHQHALVATERQSGQQLLTLFKLKQVAHETPPVLAVLYNATMLNFVTLAADKVRVWDALSGELVREYGVQLLCEGEVEDVDGNPLVELTAMCLDFRERKLVIGTTRGELSVHNFVNGACMKHLDPHVARKRASDGTEGGGGHSGGPVGQPGTEGSASRSRATAVTSLEYCKRARCVLSASWGGLM